MKLKDEEWSVQGGFELYDFFLDKGKQFCFGWGGNDPKQYYNYNIGSMTGTIKPKHKIVTVPYLLRRLVEDIPKSKYVEELDPLKQYKILTSWPGSKPVGSVIMLRESLGNQFKDFLTPHFAPIICDYELKVFPARKHKEIYIGNRTASLGCVKIDIDHLVDFYGAAQRSIDKDSDYFISSVIVENRKTGSRDSVTIEQIKEILDFADITLGK